MNGRMYDPHLGRFLSADPVIQDPSNSQCLNRYSYCINDPLALTDPSGFSFLGDAWNDICDAVKNVFHDVGHAIDSALSNQTVAAILEIAVAAVAVATLPANPTSWVLFEHFAGAAAFNGAVSYAQTGSIGVGVQTAAMTLLSEYAWAGTGAALGGAQGEIAHPIEASLVHGAVGGGLNVIEGGSFKNGFLSAAVSEALAGPIEQISVSGSQCITIMARGMAAGVVGGTVAAATGGNFENGMSTSAAAEIFNTGDEKGESIFEQAFTKGAQYYGQADQDQFQFCRDHPILASDGIILLAPGRGEAKLSEELITLYRAVSPEELSDILTTQQFRNLGSAAGEYFSTTAQGAASYAKQAVSAFGDQAYTLVSTKVPSSLITPVMQANVDRGISAVVLPDKMLVGLKPIVHNSMPIP